MNVISLKISPNEYYLFFSARLGGSLVTKGMSLIGEKVAPTPQEQKVSPWNTMVLSSSGT